MENIKLYVGENYEGELFYSTVSHNDLMEATTESFMPGGFREVAITVHQYNKLQESDGAFVDTHCLVKNGTGVRVKKLYPSIRKK